jgi:lipopolysaccharide transport system ATP-binding protein
LSKAVRIQNVSKSYPIYGRPLDRLKEMLTANRVSFHSDFWALREVSLEIERGTTYALIGENGSGKSTLLQLIAGILQPSSGEVEVNGRVSALLELGSGFNPEFTGRENVFLSGQILGIPREEMEQAYPAITDFAEIGDFIHQPVKTYSSGMLVRLAFAVAISVKPDIFIVDEALAVGDIYFRQRCMRKFHELKRQGVTIIFVSHSASDIKSLAEEVAWLDHGRLVEIGAPDRVVAKYLAAMVSKDSQYREHHLAPAEGAEGHAAEAMEAPEIVQGIPNVDHRFGNGDAEILGIAVLNEDFAPIAMLPREGTIIVRISIRARRDVPQPIVGVLIRNHLGVDLTGTNTALEELTMTPLRAGDVQTFDFRLELPELYPAHFSFTPGISNGTLETYEVCDFIDNALALPAEKGRAVYGYMHLPFQIAAHEVRRGAPLPPAKSSAVEMKQ